VEFAAYVGLDWADEKHAVCLENNSEKLIEEFELEQKPDAMHDWVAQLRQRFSGKPIAIALEQAKGAVISALMMYEFIVLYPINPKTLAKYREALAVSGSKDDPSDARLLKDFLKMHYSQLKAWIPDDAQTRLLQLLAQHRRNAVEDRVRLMHRIESLLKIYFPQALDWAGGLHTIQACDFLMRWPTLAEVQKVRPATLRKFYYSHRCRRRELIEQRIADIRLARPLTEDPALIAGLSLAVKAAVAQLRPLIDVIDEFDRQQAQLFATHPDHEIFQSLPGAGPVFAPRLSAVMGADRNRFDDASEIQRSSGIAPVTVKSGKSCWVHHRWACPKFTKQTFHEFAELSIPYSHWARACYKYLRDRGMDHHAAVRVLAYKWIRIIFVCWKERKLYDESQYIKALRRRNSPVAKFLP
jgi:transposase